MVSYGFSSFYPMINPSFPLCGLHNTTQYTFIYIQFNQIILVCVCRAYLESVAESEKIDSRRRRGFMFLSMGTNQNERSVVAENMNRPPMMMMMMQWWHTIIPTACVIINRHFFVFFFLIQNQHDDTRNNENRDRLLIHIAFFFIQLVVFHQFQSINCFHKFTFINKCKA